MIVGPLALLAISTVLQVIGSLTAVQSSVVLTACQSVNAFVQVCPANPSVIQLGLGYVLGPLLPAVGAGHVLVSPLGDGATVGFLLVFLALLPMASFDGGQISGVLWGTSKARVATYLSVVVLLALDTNELAYWGVAIAVLLVGGRPLKLSFMDDISTVSKRRLLIYLGLLFLAFLLIPIPHDIATIPLT
jgi:membrane-associated protease RseP (regulator of RpoE activity)